MDFDLTEEQQAVVDLAEQIFGDHLTAERRKAVTGGFDRSLWETLGAAGLLGISLPASCGGAEQGFLATALLAEQAGRHAAPVPVAPVLVATLTVAHCGGATSGSEIVAPALSDAGMEPTVARGGSGGWRLAGSRTCVPAGAIADRVLVPAVGDDGTGLFLVEASDATVTPLSSTSDAPFAHVDFEDAPAALLGWGDDLVEWAAHRLTAALCSQMAGAAKAAVALTAAYTKEREQFERPIATFQAVAQRAADAYIDAEGIQLTSRQAAWRLSEGLPAAEEVAIAKFWAADAGQRVVHAGVHLHGGVGVDRDYPLHRFFLMAKEIELMLGGATANLLRLGRILATEPAAV